jgi:deoxyribose-phosphate aldolase
LPHIGCVMEKTDIAQELPRALECALFAADAKREDFERLCAAAQKHGFHGIAVNTGRVELVRDLLEESDVSVIALVGFPFGVADTDAKRYETEIATDNGAHEIDYVINIGKLKEGDEGFVLREMRDIVEAADERPVKAIMEAHLLTPEEKTAVCQLAGEAGIKWLVTSTDFHSPAVTVEEIKSLREKLGKETGVKAAGGIRDLQLAEALFRAGAGRIGTTAGTSLAQG